MTEHISSRTPEGEPNRCPLCGADICLDPSRPPGDAPCNQCGTLVWFPFGKKDRQGRWITRATSFTKDLGLDSLEMADLILTFEKRFHVTIPRPMAKRIDTVGDAIEIIETLTGKRD